MVAPCSSITPRAKEGFHFHQAQWVTGNRVSCELFQAQAMTGVAPASCVRPAPSSTAEHLLCTCALRFSSRDTGERFGLQYVEPGCRPVVLNWDKNKAQPDIPAAELETEHHCPAAVVSTDTQEARGIVQDAPVRPVPILSSQQRSEAVSKSQPPLLPASAAVKSETQPLMDTGLPVVALLPVSSSPRATRTGPIKIGGLIQVLDHSRWTEAMRASIDGLLIKHHGAKDILKRVDAAMVQRSCTDPNSLLHPTTCQHISRYVKHLAKLKNTSSSLNTSPEKVLETQQL
ncbi:uncharacterized protein LOC119498894 [Sebastes umbrosus]|uniref:uncharacterized protein LOC119498894 n=1 Tax=Sebastes umbrosus TaxID=72105 RepID=UPI0018A0605E|nr:uncharacterized protein LOC119498894 [Sebastes umbrosus]